MRVNRRDGNVDFNVNNGVRWLGRRIKCNSASQSRMKTTNNVGQNDLMMRLLRRNFVHVVLVRDHLVACASFYHQHPNQQEGTNNHRLLGTITHNWMDGLNHLVLDVEGCVVNLNVTEASASYAGVLIDRDGSMKWRRRKKRKLVIFLYFLCNINYSQRCRTFFAMSRVSPMTTFPNSGWSSTQKWLN